MNMKKNIMTGAVATIAISMPVAIAVSCGSQKHEEQESVFNQGRRTLVQFIDKNNDVLHKTKRRFWDLSVQSSTISAISYYKAMITSPFQERVVQSSLVEPLPNGKKEVKKKKSVFKFGAISSVETPDGKFNSYDSLIDNLKKNKGAEEFTFRAKKGVHYINSKGEKTKYKYKAIDMFYGFIRTIYASREARQKGTIMGKNPIPAFTPEYLKKLKDSDEFYANGKLNSKGYNNNNVYINNLYGIDLAGTIKANTGKNYDSDKFTLKFAGKRDESIIKNYLANYEFFNPVPSQKILELNGGYKDFAEPGKFTQLLEWGSSKRTGDKIDLSGELTIGRFYMSNYDSKIGSKGLVIKKNVNSWDEEWNKNDKTLEKVQYIFYDSTDPDVVVQERNKKFLEDNSESLLNGRVLENATLMNKTSMKARAVERKSSTKGLVVGGIMNPWFMLSTKNNGAKLDDNTSKLLFGKSVKDSINDVDSDDEYFRGRGRVFRSLLNSSINLYGLTNQLLPGSSLSKLAQYYQPGSVVVGDKTIESESKTDKRLGLEHGIATDQEQMEWFLNNNSKDKSEFMKPTGKKYDVLKKQWKEFLDKARKDLKLPANAKFTFPIYDYRATDDTESNMSLNAYKEIIRCLNEITSGSNIEFKEFKAINNKDKNAENQYKTAPFIYANLGPDYNSVLSLTQQLFSAHYGFGMLYSVVAEALESKDNTVKVFTKNQDSWDLSEKVSIKDLIDFMKDPKNKGDYSNALKPGVLKSINMKDWSNWRAGDSFNQEKSNALNELDNAAQKFLFANSSNEAIVKKYINLLGDYSMADKLSVLTKKYRSLGSKLGKSLPTSKIYSSKWIHFAQSSISREGINLIDTYVD